MKKNLFYYLFAVLCTVTLFTSCSDDDEPTPGGGPSSLVENVMGTYDGSFTVDLNGTNITPTPLAQRIFVKQDGADKVELSLRNFSILVGETSLEVGDIVVGGIALGGEDAHVQFQETKVTQHHELLGDLDITISGTVAGEMADLNIGVIQHMENGSTMNITVAFEGERISKEIFDNDYALDLVASYARENMTVEGLEDITEFPDPDKIEFSYKTYNVISIKSFKLTYPRSSTLNNVYISADEIPVMKQNDGSIELLKTTTVYTDKTNGDIEIEWSGKVVDKVLTLNMTLTRGESVVKYVFTGGGKFTGKAIESLKINSDAIVYEPVINGTKITFFVKSGADMNLVPEVVISAGATLQIDGNDYVAGEKVDFSDKKTFKVTSESGSSSDYTVWAQYIDNFETNLEAWSLKNATLEAGLQYYEPVNGWATSNEGLKWIRSMYQDEYYPLDAPYLVTEADVNNRKAAKIETVDTKGAFVILTSIPKVTSGSLYNGYFEVDIFNTLKSTKFGSPCTKEPKTFSGVYKYSAGPVYYQAKYPGDPKKAHEVEEDKTKTDAPALNAVLYEVEDYYTESLNGTDLFTSDKVVATAIGQNLGEQSDFVPFSVNFEWKNGKSWDASKKYKLAIVCSSSKDGDKFSGAPGSVLYVDDLKVSF